MNTVDRLTREQAAEVAVNRAQQLKMHDLEAAFYNTGIAKLRYVKRTSTRGQTYFVVIQLYHGSTDAGDAIGAITPGGSFFDASTYIQFEHGERFDLERALQDNRLHTQ